MTIHHATVKSAASKGVILTQDGDLVTAHRPEPNRRVSFAIEGENDEPTQIEATERAKDAWVTLDEILAFEAEHPNFRIEYNEDGDYVGTLYPQDPNSPDGEIARDPDLADLFETLLDQPEGEDGDEAEAEEEDAGEGGSVVPAKYKALYAERGDPTNCGDWLAVTLNGICKLVDAETKKEVTDLDRLETIANANDVSPERYGKLGVATNGWQGRFRMTVRNMLVPRVAAKGFLFVPDGADGGGEREIKAPGEWVAAHLAKKAAKAPVVAKDEGAGKPSAKTAAKRASKDQGEAGLAEASRALKSARARKAG